MFRFTVQFNKQIYLLVGLIMSPPSRNFFATPHTCGSNSNERNHRFIAIRSKQRCLLSILHSWYHKTVTNTSKTFESVRDLKRMYKKIPNLHARWGFERSRPGSVMRLDNDMLPLSLHERHQGKSFHPGFD